VTDPLKHILFMPDTHAPYHNKRAVELFLQVGMSRTWDELIILGDFFDCYALSSYRKDPSREASMQAELNEAIALLTRVSQIKAHRKRIVWGNHEFRLVRYLMDKCPELYKLLMEDGDLFSFKALSWEETGYMKDVRVGKINVTHDLGRAGPTALKYALHDYQDNIVIGHTHIMQFLIEANARGKPHVGASFGWLGDVNRIDYKHLMKARKDFVLGFGTAHMRRDNGCVYINPHPIVGYSCVVDGQLFKG